MPRFDAEWIEFMLRPELRGAPSAEETLKLIGPRPGQMVADVGCGPGFFTLPAAVAVGPTGRVYAVDIATQMLELVRARAAAARLDNVETRQASELALPLDDASADVTICGLVLHDLVDRVAMARELARITRPDGAIAVIEWTVESDFKRPNRVPPDELARLLADVGRHPGAAIPLEPKQYLMLA